MPPAAPRPSRRRPLPRAVGPSPYDARPWLASYPKGVPADVEVPSVPVTRLLDDAAASFPTGTALVFLGTRTSYRELRQQVDAFASALAGLGVTRGDRVAVVLPNCPQNVVAFFAVLRLGAVVVQHNPLSTRSELRAQLADCGARVVVCLDRGFETVVAVQPQTAVEHVVVASFADALSSVARLRLRLPGRTPRRTRAELVTALPQGARVRRFADLVRDAGGPARQVAVDPATDLALLQYTGGTTGVSRGAMLTHTNLVANAWMNRLWDPAARPGREVTLGVLPLFHVYGLTVAMLHTVLLGGTLVLLPRFDLARVFAAIDEHRPTLLPGVPPGYRAMADSPLAREHDLGSLRLCVSGAMRLPVEVQQRFEAISGARLVEGYGTTETSPSTHANPTVGERRPGTIGLPLPGTRCRVVAQDDPDREVAVGEPGELVVAGPQVFAGYWGRPDLEGVFTSDGYLLTGDVVVMDEDGWFTVVDRKKELIVTGGFNVYPSEVEQVLLRLPGVTDAAVIGVPDRHRGETVKAFVVATGLTVPDVVDHCAAELTAYKVPVVELIDDLPRSAVGKVLRRVLVEQERARAAAAEQPRPASLPPGCARLPDEQLPTGPEPGPREAEDPVPAAVAAPRPRARAAKTVKSVQAGAAQPTKAAKPDEAAEPSTSKPRTAPALPRARRPRPP